MRVERKPKARKAARKVKKNVTFEGRKCNNSVTQPTTTK